MLNVIGTARATEQGTLTQTANGKDMGVLRVAFSRTYTNGSGQKVEDTSFVDLIGFGSTGQALASRVKGENLHIVGRLSVRTNKANSTTYTNVSVVCNEVEFLTTKAQREALIARQKGEQVNEAEVEYAEAYETEV